MNTEEHLKRIKEKCEELLAIAETPNTTAPSVDVPRLVRLAKAHDPDIWEDDVKEVVGWVADRQDRGLPVRPRGSKGRHALGAVEMNVVFALVAAGVLEIRGRDGSARSGGSIDLDDMVWPGPQWQERMACDHRGD